MIDLHMHTNISDGELTPKELSRYCIDKGMHTISFTDHDSIDAYSEDLDLINIVPGIEITCFWRSYEIHILGYGSGILEIGPYLQSLEIDKKERNQRLLRELHKMGIDFHKNNIFVKEGSFKKYLAKYLVDQQYTKSIQESFWKYINPSLAGIERKNPANVTGIIRESNATPIIAHPTVYKNVKIEELIEECILNGLKGIEIFTPRNDKIEYFLQLASVFGLVVTGGSDFHRLNGGPDVGDGNYPYEYYCKFIEVI
ncbi:PHP domain-containing protein [Thermodesulfobacteriota bacterium]